jgi:protein-S-isoprenylcysteine O-methyltransferase Ste14
VERLQELTTLPSPTPPDTANERRVGWTYVGVQAVLLLIVFAPIELSRSWRFQRAGERVAEAAVLIGFVLIGLSAVWLGRGLTPHPAPNGRVTLRTRGPYRVVRHPMYVGVMLVALGSAVRAGSWVRFGAAAGLVVLFSAKARFEERSLLANLAGYGEYAEHTGRFVPGFGRIRPGA